MSLHAHASVPLIPWPFLAALRRRYRGQSIIFMLSICCLARSGLTYPLSTYGCWLCALPSVRQRCSAMVPTFHLTNCDWSGILWQQSTITMAQKPHGNICDRGGWARTSSFSHRDWLLSWASLEPRLLQGLRRGSAYIEHRGLHLKTKGNSLFIQVNFRFFFSFSSYLDVCLACT